MCVFRSALVYAILYEREKVRLTVNFVRSNVIMRLMYIYILSNAEYTHTHIRWHCNRLVYDCNTILVSRSAEYDTLSLCLNSVVAVKLLDVNRVFFVIFLGLSIAKKLENILTETYSLRRNTNDLRLSKQKQIRSHR